MAVSLGAATAFVALQRTETWQRLETQALDQRFQIRGPRQAPKGVVVVAIDDRSVAELGGWPIRRDLLSVAIDRINMAGASVVGIDLLLPALPGAGAEQQDTRVADSLESSVPVILAAARPRPTTANGRDAAATDGDPDLILPAPTLAAAADLGHVNIRLDVDGRLRRLLTSIGDEASALPALPLAMARIISPAVADTESRFLWLDFYGPSGTIRTVSLSDLVHGNIETDVLRGRAVLIGATASGLGDAFATPLSAQLPGVEYFATALGNLLDGRLLKRDEQVIALDALIVGLSALLAVVVSRMLPPALAAAVVVGVAAGVLAAGQYAFSHHGVWFSAIGPPLAMAVALTGSFGSRLLAERRKRRHSEVRVQNLRRYVAPALADTLAEQAIPGFTDRVQSAAVLFIDIAGFTGISEAIGPEPTARLLRSFHGSVEDIVNAHDGVLTSFLGDGAMAVFGLVTPRNDDAARALAAARQLAHVFATWDPMRIGIGLHAGPVAVAQLGGRAQVQITVTGDTVNLASRLEHLTRQHSAAIALSDAVLAAVRKTGPADLLDGLRPLGTARIRGRRATIEAWMLPAMKQGQSAA